MIPALKDPLENPKGFSLEPPKPLIEPRGGFKDLLYRVEDVVSDWDGYSAALRRARPELKPRVLLVSHDMSEIENITLMALGGVVKAMNGAAHYLLVNPGNTKAIDAAIEAFRPDFLAFNLYTGLTDHVFEWLQRYRLESARRVFKKEFRDFAAADKALKDAVTENKGAPLREGGRTVFAPVLIGGHYNNHDFRTSWDRGADFSVRGKGINLLKDVLAGHFTPGIYHDPQSFPNIPVFDRAGFYRDTFAFSDETKKYALSPVKSVLTALGCAYRCTYCYIGSLVENLEAAYKDKGVKPPSIIQDRPLETVLQEGRDIRTLDASYGVRTTAVFDQADISLNNLEWWTELGRRWTKEVAIPFYIQARPAMLAGKQGRERIAMIAKDNLVAGISMAVESGDEAVRRLLLKRMEPNSAIVDALRNAKAAMIPVRTQVITGLPVIRPFREPKAEVGLVAADGTEHYYDDPLQETLKALDLLCSTGLFGKEDYYWNSLYSPFPGTPLGDYSIDCGFHDGGTDNKERAYMFTSEVGLECFPPHVVRKQTAFHRTANFFAHLLNGKDMMTLYLYSRDAFALDDFADFVADKAPMFKTAKLYTKFGLIPEPTDDMLRGFIEHAYPDAADAAFKALNLKLVPYYSILLDGMLLAAKVAEFYFKQKERGKGFGLDQLTRVERNHYYDNSYNMTYLPPRFAAFLRPYIHENRLVLVAEKSREQTKGVEALDSEVLRSGQ
ncbi:MAG: radical SAM protein [Elusimicrobiota bacterium]|nr:radical SAM protein [Elusimicrobiota bacterium]